MKKSIYFLSVLTFALTSCSNETETQTKIQTAAEIDSLTTVAPTEESTVVTEPNLTIDHPLGDIEGLGYKEYYEGGALKIVGDLDDDGERNGLWVSYYENGIKWSESYYSHGKKSGHSITFFPNGKVRYVGEYLNDKKTGDWTFYDESGNVIKQETY